MFELFTEVKSVKTDEDSGELRIKGLASTPSTDRARDIITVDAWSKGGIDNYRKNPILLFNHNYDEPIGKAEVVNITPEGLELEGLIYPDTKAYSLIKSGVLKTFSVGFLIKDADYNRANDGLIITDAELLEVSVVSVPCNQDATFELSKSADSTVDIEQLKQKYGKETSVEGAEASEEIEMTKEEMEKLMAEASSKAVADALAAKEKADKEKADKAAAEKEAEEAREKEVNDRVSATVEATMGEKLTKAVEEAMTKSSEEAAATIKSLEDQLKEYGEEIKSFRESRGGMFEDRGGNHADFKTMLAKDEETRTEAIHGYLLAKAVGKSVGELEMTKSLMEKVNTQSSVQVSSDSFEQLVSTEIYRDIEQELVIKPLFREVTLNSASQLLTIAPDTGYATHQTTGSSLPGTKPNGLLNMPDGSQPYTLGETVLRTDKLVSKAFLANDTEEDAIMPILPIIRDGMVRQHAKSVDQMILTAGVAGGVYPNMTSKGLAAYAATNSRTVDGGSVAGTSTVTGKQLLSARRGMGKYGLSPSDIVYVVSTNAYFDLLEDEDFYDNYQVGEGTKVRGEIGRMFGSRILVSDELSSTVAAGEIAAYAINTRNFVIPRLRGLTSESEYSVDGQHWLLATTQRLGFTEIIPDATSVVALAYTA